MEQILSMLGVTEEQLQAGMTGIVLWFAFSVFLFALSIAGIVGSAVTLKHYKAQENEDKPMRIFGIVGLILCIIGIFFKYAAIPGMVCTVLGMIRDEEVRGLLKYFLIPFCVAAVLGVIMAVLLPSALNTLGSVASDMLEQTEAATGTDPFETMSEFDEETVNPTEAGSEAGADKPTGYDDKYKDDIKEVRQYDCDDFTRVLSPYFENNYSYGKLRVESFDLGTVSDAGDRQYTFVLRDNMDNEYVAVYSNSEELSSDTLSSDTITLEEKAAEVPASEQQEEVVSNPQEEVSPEATSEEVPEEASKEGSEPASEESAESVSSEETPSVEASEQPAEAPSSSSDISQDELAKIIEQNM